MDSSPIMKRERHDVSLRFNERTANPGVVFSGSPSGLIGGLPGRGPAPAGSVGEPKFVGFKAQSGRIAQNFGIPIHNSWVKKGRNLWDSSIICGTDWGPRRRGASALVLAPSRSRFIQRNRVVWPTPRTAMASRICSPEAIRTELRESQPNVARSTSPADRCCRYPRTALPCRCNLVPQITNQTRRQSQKL
jgi:hypothetical protein